MARNLSHISQVMQRLRAAWSEMDYAQRRLFELRTGIPVDGPRPRRRPLASAEQFAPPPGTAELPSFMRWPYLRH